MILESYTKQEKQNITKMHEEGKFSCFCPRCDEFWVRDYSFPIRTCPACGHIKPWADKNLIVKY